MKHSKRSRKRNSGQGWSVTTSGTETAVAAVETSSPKGPALVRLRLERRRGKPVTVAAVEGLEGPALGDLARELKVRCGSGGTLKNAELELQGDHRELLRALLPGRGLRVKG